MTQYIQPTLERDADLRAEVERQRAANEALMVDVQNLQADVLAKNREIGRLKRELDKLERRHAPTRDVEEVFGHWALRCCERTPKFGEARQKAIRTQLKHFSVDDLKRAIDGAARLPYVGSRGRQAVPPHPGAKRQTELTLILRDETYVERFMGYADGGGRADGVDPPNRPPAPEGLMRSRAAGGADD